MILCPVGGDMGLPASRLAFTGAGRVSLSLLLAVAWIVVGCAEMPVEVSQPPPTPSPAQITVKTVPAGAYLSGLQAVRDNKLRQASRFLRAAQLDDPEEKEVLSQLFRIEISLGRIEQARELARSGQSDRLAFGSATLLLLIEAVDAGDFMAARRIIDQLTDHGLRRIIRPAAEAWISGLRGDWQEAADRMNQEDATRSPIYHRQAALINDLAGRGDEAARLYALLATPSHRLTERPARLAMNFFARIGDSGAMETLRNRWKRENINEPAYSGLSFAVPTLLEPAPAALVQDARQGWAELMIETAESLIRARVGEAALSYAWMGLALDPNHLDGQILAARLLTLLERHDEAIEKYHELMQDGRVRLFAALNLSRAYELTDKIDKARSVLDMISPEPDLDQTRVLVALGDLLYRQEDFSAAIGVYTRAIASTSPGQDNWRVLFHRGICYERSDQWAKAEADLLAALRMSPDQPRVMNYLGYSWINQGKNIDRARAMIERAVLQSPNDGYFIDSLGWAFYRLGDFFQAAEQLERAVELLPHDAVINDHLGDALWRVGRLLEARFQWERVLQLKLKPDLAALVRAKLDTGGLPDVKTASHKSEQSR